MTCGSRVFLYFLWLGVDNVVFRCFGFSQFVQLVILCVVSWVVHFHSHSNQNSSGGLRCSVFSIIFWCRCSLHSVGCSNIVIVIVRSEVSLILEFFCGRFWCFLCIFCNHPTLFNSFSFVHWVSAHLTVLSFLPALLVLFLPALLVLPALLYWWGTLTGFFFFPFYIILYLCFFPSFLYRIAAAWLLHMRASAGWELTLRAVWSSHPLKTQFICTDTGSRTIDIVAWPCLPRPFQSLSPYG